MPGSSSVTGDQTITYTDNMCFDGTARGAPMNTDGQLWIGATSSNRSNNGGHVRLGSITSSDSSITIGYSAPNITLVVSGGTTVGKTITGDVGGAISPTAGNWNIFASTVPSGTTPIQTSGSGSTLTINVQRSQAISAVDITKVGLANFNSAQFSVTNGFVSLSGGGFTWNDVSGAFSPIKENGYFVTATSTGTLPASPSQGDTIQFFVDHATQLLTIQATGTQIIRFATQVSSAAGTAVSTQQGDSVELVYRSSDTCWCAVDFNGGWNFT